MRVVPPIVCFCFSLLLLGCQKDPDANNVGVPARGRGELTPASPFPPSPPRRFRTQAELTPAEAAIVAKLTSYLRTDAAARRKALAAEIEALPGWRPDRLSDWLHLAQAHPQPPAAEWGKATTHDVPVDSVPGDRAASRPVEVHLPKSYSAAQPWPLLLCYHPTGGNGELMLSYARALLGEAFDDFILAAPSNPRPLNVDSHRCRSKEAPMLLDYLRREFHVDSDRVYALGYSQGGYAVWSLATFFGDQLAGAIPVSCTFDAAPEVEGLWESLAPNLGQLPILASWGTNDQGGVPGFDLKTLAGRIGPLNEQRLLPLTQKLNLNVRHWRVSMGGHGFDVSPAEAKKLLALRRDRNPARIVRRFRFLHQGDAGWLQALAWSGPQWDENSSLVPTAAGQAPSAALGRAIQERLALLEGEAKGNTLSIKTTNLGEVALWLTEGFIDWEQPLRVTVQGQLAFEGQPRRDLYLCLEEARRTGDFDRLRWAKLRFDGHGRPLKD